MENNIEEVHCYSSLQRSVLFLNPKYNHVLLKKVSLFQGVWVVFSYRFGLVYHLALYVHSAFFTSRFLNFYIQTFGGWGVLLIEHAKSGRVCLFKSFRRLHFNHAVVVD